MSWHYGFRPYVPVAQRRRNAQKEMAKLAKKDKAIHPVVIEGKTIANSFWGRSWCDNLESYMDYANRLPRGRTYVRNGSVVHLSIQSGEIEARVSGSELYSVQIKITPVAAAKWKSLCAQCAGGIGSVIELLQGKFSDQVMAIVTDKDHGLFPSPKEIRMSCSCPDSASLCKHLAAALYGVGARLDNQPELLFTLRSVDHEELISHAASGAVLAGTKAASGEELAEDQLASVFGIEIEAASPSRPAPKAAKAKKPAPKKATRKAVSKKSQQT